MIEQRLQQRRLVRAHRLMHARRIARRRIAGDAVMRGQRVDVIGDARAGRHLRVIGASRGKALVERVGVEMMRLIGQHPPNSRRITMRP